MRMPDEIQKAQHRVIACESKYGIAQRRYNEALIREDLTIAELADLSDEIEERLVERHEARVALAEKVSDYLASLPADEVAE